MVGLVGITALAIQYSKGIFSFSPRDTDVVSVVISLLFFAAAFGAGVLLMLRKPCGVILMLSLSFIWVLYVCVLLVSFSGLAPPQYQYLLFVSLTIPISSMVAGLWTLVMRSRL